MPIIKTMLERQLAGPPTAQHELNQAVRKLMGESKLDPRTTAASMMVSAVRMLIVLDARSHSGSDEQTRDALHTMLDQMLIDAFDQRDALFNASRSPQPPN